MKNLLNRITNLFSNQALVYAICCTLSISIASLLQTYLHMPTELFLFFILSASLSSFYSYGKTVPQKSNNTLLGVIITCLICYGGVWASPHLFTAIPYLAAASFLLYLFSETNIAAAFRAKLVIFLLSFCIVISPHHEAILAWDIFIALFAGGLVAIFANASIQLFDLWLRKFYTLNWQTELVAICQKILATTPIGKFEPSTINSFGKIINNITSTDQLQCWRIERIVLQLEATYRLYSTSAFLQQIFADDFENLLIAISEAFEKGHAQSLATTTEKLTQRTSDLRKEGYFYSQEIINRINSIEFIFCTRQITTDIKNLLDLKKSSPSRPSVLSKNKKNHFTSTLKNLFMPNKGERWSTPVKIGIRAAIAMSIALAACQILGIEHGAWVILSTNFVLLLRQGDTIKKGIDRILGHATGFIIAILFYGYILKYVPTPYLWVPLLTFLSSYYILKNYFIFSNLLMIVILYLYLYVDPNLFTHISINHFMLSRLENVTLGSIIAILAGLSIFPNVGLNPLFATLAKSFAKLTTHLENLPRFIGQDEKFCYLKMQEISSSLHTDMDQLSALLHSLGFQPKRFQLQYNSKKIIIQGFAEIVFAFNKAFSKLINEKKEINKDRPVNNLFNESLKTLCCHYSSFSKILSECPTPEKLKQFSQLHLNKITNETIQINQQIEDILNSSDNKVESIETIANSLTVINGLEEIRSSLKNMLQNLIAES